MIHEEIDIQTRWNYRQDHIDQILDIMACEYNSEDRNSLDPEGCVKGRISPEEGWKYHLELITTPTKEDIKSDLISEINRDIENGKYDSLFDNPIK